MGSPNQPLRGSSKRVISSLRQNHLGLCQNQRHPGLIGWSGVESGIFTLARSQAVGTQVPERRFEKHHRRSLWSPSEDAASNPLSICCLFRCAEPDVPKEAPDRRDLSLTLSVSSPSAPRPHPLSSHWLSKALKIPKEKSPGKSRIQPRWETCFFVYYNRVKQHCLAGIWWDSVPSPPSIYHWGYLATGAPLWEEAETITRAPGSPAQAPAAAHMLPTGRPCVCWHGYTSALASLNLEFQSDWLSNFHSN